MAIIDKIFCMSSYMAFHYIEKDGMEFYPGLHYENYQPIPDAEGISMQYLFERYRLDGDKIDFLKFMDDVFSI